MADKYAAMATNKKISEVYRLVKNNDWVLNPFFQRRQVWREDNKGYFIETILLGLPFPEIYTSVGELNIEEKKNQDYVVDGQQRISTIVNYMDGKFIPQNGKSYELLTDEEKRKFLQYPIVVRELGDVSKEQLIEIFKRINATNFALNSMEIDNAEFNGPFIELAKKITGNDFFEIYKLFNSQQQKRMNDVRFILTLIVLTKTGYFARDAQVKAILADSEDVLYDINEIDNSFNHVLSNIQLMDLPKRSIWFKKIEDFLTLFIELSYSLKTQSNINLDQLRILLVSFNEKYIMLDKKQEIDEGVGVLSVEDVKEYYRNSKTYAREKLQRIIRGKIMQKLIKSVVV